MTHITSLRQEFYTFWQFSFPILVEIKSVRSGLPLALIVLLSEGKRTYKYILSTVTDVNCSYNYGSSVGLQKWFGMVRYERV